MSILLILSLIAPAYSQDLFLAAKSPVDATVTPANCPPKEWVLQMYGGGSWVLDYQDGTWDAFMEFLGLDKSAWPTEAHTKDIHEFHMSKDGTYYLLNHTIPLSNFHLFFKTELGTSSKKSEWVTSPYTAPTPAGFNPHPLKFNFTKWRNFIEEPGMPFPESCYALRTQNRGIYNNSGTLSELVVDFTGELTSPYEWRYSLHVWDFKTGEIIEPWRSQLQDAKPHPGVSFRYFKKPVQSFADAEARNSCTNMTLKGQTYQFC